MKELIIDKLGDNQRLDKYLSKYLSAASKSFIVKRAMVIVDMPFGSYQGNELGGIGFRYPYYERKPCRRPQTGGRRGNHRYGEAYPQRRYSHHGTSRTDAPIHQQVWNI